MQLAAGSLFWCSAHGTILAVNSAGAGGRSGLAGERFIQQLMILRIKVQVMTSKHHIQSVSCSEGLFERDSRHSKMFLKSFFRTYLVVP